MQKLSVFCNQGRLWDHSVQIVSVEKYMGKQELLSQREQMLSADQKPKVFGKEGRKCYSPDLFRIAIWILLEHDCVPHLC